MASLVKVMVAKHKHDFDFVCPRESLTCTLRRIVQVYKDNKVVQELPVTGTADMTYAYVRA
jgi:hypothetical protein